jgi:hypothetical protein
MHTDAPPTRRRGRSVVAAAADATAPRPVPAGPIIAALSCAVVTLAVLRGWLLWNRDAALDDKLPARWVMNGTLVLQGGLTAAFTVVAVATMRRNRASTRGVQRLLGSLATVTLLTCLGAVFSSIYRRNDASYALLSESFGLYLAINFVFVFWYWYADHRPWVAALDDGSVRLGGGIRFPEDDLATDTERPGAWLPGIIDYAYFTLLSSNCFGAPEGHVLIGRTLKLIQMVHTACMLFLFIIVVSRAVNTLG